MNGKKPRILLVQPTTVHLDGTPHKTRWRLIMGLMIPLMAGLTPDDYDVTLCDERLEDINFDGGWDLVGMTTTIGASLRVPAISPGRSPDVEPYWDIVPIAHFPFAGVDRRGVQTAFRRTVCGKMFWLGNYIMIGGERITLHSTNISKTKLP